MTLNNAIAQVRRELPSEHRIHPGTAPAVRQLLAYAEKHKSLDELTDSITNLIDDGIHESRYETYSEWQKAVASLLEKMGMTNP